MRGIGDWLLAACAVVAMSLILATVLALLLNAAVEARTGRQQNPYFQEQERRDWRPAIRRLLARLPWRGPGRP